MKFGAECLPAGGVRFRLWAPAAGQVELCLPDARGEAVLPMATEGEGWFERTVAEAAPGTRYLYRIDGVHRIPDPASRYNPEDVHGPSEVVDPEAFDWGNVDWRGRPWHEAVIYELHVGAFTPEGTFRAVIDRLDHLVELGVTALQLMPVADFPGRRGWGYDGVLPFAPEASYGRPEDLKALVMAAHARGLMVLLDVVYNHFGPEGNYLHLYAPGFFTERHHTPWGAALNFDGPDSRTVREFFIHNALYWLEEYGFDGLRLDAVHAIFDDSRPDLLEELAQRVRDGQGHGRHIHLVLENDDNDPACLRRAEGHPVAYAAQWNDDFHHVMHLLLTGEADGYYADYAEAPARHLARILAEGFAYQGERSTFRHGSARGQPSAHLPPQAFVNFLQNHDQVGNRAFGERLVNLVEPGRLRAALAVMLLAPSPPLLFMGEEWAASTPFLFFCDFSEDLHEAVREGRRREFARFERFRAPAAREVIPDPDAADTFTRSRLDWRERGEPGHRDWLAFYRRLLRLRAERLLPRLEGSRALGAGALGPAAVQAAWRLGDGGILRLWANLGAEAVRLDAPPSGERLLAVMEAPEIPCEASLPPASAFWSLEPAEARHGGTNHD